MRRGAGALAVTLALLGASACSRDAGAASDNEADVIAARDALVAARALFEAGQLDAALARLDASNPLHIELRDQIEQELHRLATIEKFNTWSVGPAKMSRSLKQAQQLCKRRGGNWVTVDDGMSACSEEGKIAIIRVRDGSINHLTGMYSSEYVSVRNPGLYENELRLLRESFGEPYHATDDPSSPLEWAVSGDRMVQISRSADGTVFLAVGLASGFTDDSVATMSAVQEALPEQGPSGPRVGTHRIRVSTTSRTACSDGEVREGRPEADTLHWIVSEDGSIRAQLESQREGQATRDFYVEGRAQGRSATLSGTNIAFIFQRRMVWRYEFMASLTPQGDFESGRLVKRIEGGDCNITQRITAS